MIGKLIKIELKTYNTKDGKKFKKVEFTCDVKINDKGDIRTVRGSYSEDFARKYFEFCGVKTKDAIGTEVDVTLAKRTYKADDGDERTISYIKFLNLLDDEGKKIIMPKEGSEALDF